MDNVNEPAANLVIVKPLDRLAIEIANMVLVYQEAIAEADTDHRFTKVCMIAMSTPRLASLCDMAKAEITLTEKMAKNDARKECAENLKRLAREAEEVAEGETAGSYLWRQHHNDAILWNQAARECLSFVEE